MERIPFTRSTFAVDPSIGPQSVPHRAGEIRRGVAVAKRRNPFPFLLVADHSAAQPRQSM